MQNEYEERNCLCAFILHFAFCPSYAEHEPGGPPHRPQIGTAAEEDLTLSAATAKRLNDRNVFVEPHCGHLAGVWSLMVRINCSNLTLQDLQVYS